MFEPNIEPRTVRYRFRTNRNTTVYDEVQSPKRSCLERERKIIGTTSKPRSSTKAKFTKLKAVTGHTRRNEFHFRVTSPVFCLCCLEEVNLMPRTQEYLRLYQLGACGLLETIMQVMVYISATIRGTSSHLENLVGPTEGLVMSEPSNVVHSS